MAPADVKKQKKESLKIRLEPDQQELNAATEYIRNEFPRSSIKFLFNTDNAYRFRINRGGDVGLDESHFIVATITLDGIVTEIRSNAKPSMN